MALAIFTAEEVDVPSTPTTMVDNSAGNEAVDLLEGGSDEPNTDLDDDPEFSHDHGEPVGEAVAVDEEKPQSPESKDEPQPQPVAATAATTTKSQPYMDDHMQEIYEAECRCQEHERRMTSLKEELKEEKKEYEGAVIHLRKLIRRKAWDKGSFGPTGAAAVEIKESGESTTGEAVVTNEFREAAEIEATQTTTIERDIDAWRKVSIDVILEPKINGMGKKKVEALTDACPTLGDFSDARVKAAGNCVSTVLPDGIGLEIGSELENRFLEWSSASKNRHYFYATVGEAVGPVVVESPTVMQSSPVVFETDEELDEHIGKRIDAIEAGEVVVNAENHHAFEVGLKAFNEGDDATACIYPPGPLMDNWLCGWVSAKTLEGGDVSDLPENADLEDKFDAAVSSPSLPQFSALDDL